MTPPEIRISAEPVDIGRCKFLVSEPVNVGGVRRFASPEEAKGSPLVEAIFAIPGADVAEVIVSGSLVTVAKRSATPWQVVGKAGGQAIPAALASGRPAVAAQLATSCGGGGGRDAPVAPGAGPVGEQGTAKAGRPRWPRRPIGSAST